MSRRTASLSFDRVARVSPRHQACDSRSRKVSDGSDDFDQAPRQDAGALIRFGCDSTAIQALDNSRAPLTLDASLSKVHSGCSPACVANAT